jgi:hypothetical protein
MPSDEGLPNANMMVVKTPLPGLGFPHITIHVLELREQMLISQHSYLWVVVCLQFWKKELKPKAKNLYS